VKSEPPGAQVLLDDKPAGLTPLTIEKLAPGEHTLVLEFQGYASREKKVSYDGKRLEVSETLEKEAYGSIRVKGSGAPAQISFQGVPRGAPPVAIDRVPPGEYALEVTGPGGVVYEVPVRVERDKAAQVKVDFDELAAKEEKAFRDLPRGESLERTAEILSGFLRAWSRGKYAAETKAVLGELDAARRSFEGFSGLSDPVRKIQAAEDYLKAYRDKVYPLRWHVEEVEAARDALRTELESKARDRIDRESDFFGRRRAAQDYLEQVPWGARGDEVRALIKALEREERAFNDWRAASIYGDKVSRGRAYVEQFPQGLKAEEVKGEVEALEKAEAAAWSAVEAEKDPARRAEAAEQYASRFAGSPRAEKARASADAGRSEWKAYQETAKSAEACRKYLDEFPTGAFRAEVEKRLARFGWPAGKGYVAFEGGALPEAITRGESPGEYVNSWDRSAMVYVPEGFYPLGSADFFSGSDDGPEVMVWLSGYFIDKYEVSNRQYGEFLKWWKSAKNRRRFSHPEEPAGFDPTPAFWNDPSFNRPDQPVVGVSWFGAWAYAHWAGKTLPTEAQWEKAASANLAQRTKRKYPWGDDPPSPTLCNFDGNEKKPASTTQFSQGASPFGAVNMAGNVAEWCLDPWRSDYLEALAEELKKRSARWAINPCAEGGGDGSHAVRGGSWEDGADEIMVSRRSGTREASEKTGFRCAAWHVGRE
jgi:formylglycine-generating enzyme required for sulfatase activity